MNKIEIQIENCLSNIRKESIRLIGLLLELDHKDIHLLQAYGSLNQYLAQRFSMSDQQAYFYANIVRLLKKHPQFWGEVKNGHISLSNLDLVARKAEDEALRRNLPKPAAEKALLIEANGKTKRKFQEHLKSLQATPTSSLFDLPAPKKTERLELDEETLGLLKQLGDELGIKDKSELIKVCLNKVLKQKRLQTKAGLIRQSERPTRLIPAHVKRSVRERAQHQCEFEAKNGKRCEGRTHLHYDHIRPYSLGGSNDFQNIQLLCANHNLMRARQGGLVAIRSRIGGVFGPVGGELKFFGHIVEQLGGHSEGQGAVFADRHGHQALVAQNVGA